MRTSSKPNKLYITRTVLMRAIQKCTFFLIWATMSKVMGIYIKFWHFLRCPLSKYGHVTRPKKQISKNIIITTFNIRKSYKIFSRNAVYFRNYRPKTSWGGGWKTPPVLLGLRKVYQRNLLKKVKITGQIVKSTRKKLVSLRRSQWIHQAVIEMKIVKQLTMYPVTYLRWLDWTYWRTTDYCV